MHIYFCLQLSLLNQQLLFKVCHNQMDLLYISQKSLPAAPYEEFFVQTCFQGIGID